MEELLLWNISSWGTFYKRLVNFMLRLITCHDYFFVCFWEWRFSRRLFLRKNFFQVLTETIQCLSSFDDRKCWNKEKKWHLTVAPVKPFWAQNNKLYNHSANSTVQQSSSKCWSSWSKKVTSHSQDACCQ